MTNGERPSWLADNDRISVVSHWDMFKDRAALPVFNSNAIEMNLYRIPNLTPNYIYMNDDLAFTGVVQNNQVENLALEYENSRIIVFTTL